MGPRTGPENVENRNVLILPGIEPRTFSPSLYRLGIHFPLLLTYESASCFLSRNFPFLRNGNISRHCMQTVSSNGNSPNPSSQHRKLRNECKLTHRYEGGSDLHIGGVTAESAVPVAGPGTSRTDGAMRFPSGPVSRVHYNMEPIGLRL
jgi:hypothetical protein